MPLLRRPLHFDHLNAARLIPAASQIDAGALIFNISLTNNGNCRVTRSTAAGDVSSPVVLCRPDLEHYFKGSVLLRGALADAWEDLDRFGIVEFSVVE